MVMTDLLAEEVPSLSDAAQRHLRVVRPKDGEAVELFDGAGRTRRYRYRAGVLAADGPVVLSPRPMRSLTLFACVTKGSRWDWTLEKATELGVTRIVPVLSARTIVRLAEDERDAKRARWQRIAEEAAAQSDAAWVPEVAAPVDFAASLPLVKAVRCFAGALTEPPPQPLAKALASVEADAALAVFIGPEGDFTPEELSALLAVATPVSLGDRVLRSETAAIFALSVLRGNMV